jgi:hypothetical protein
VAIQPSSCNSSSYKNNLAPISSNLITATFLLLTKSFTLKDLAVGKGSFTRMQGKAEGLMKKRNALRGHGIATSVNIFFSVKGMWHFGANHNKAR